MMCWSSSRHPPALETVQEFAQNSISICQNSFSQPVQSFGVSAAIIVIVPPNHSRSSQTRQLELAAGLAVTIFQVLCTTTKLHPHPAISSLTIKPGAETSTSIVFILSEPACCP